MENASYLISGIPFRQQEKSRIHSFSEISHSSAAADPFKMENDLSQGKCFCKKLINKSITVILFRGNLFGNS